MSEELENSVIEAIESESFLTAGELEWNGRKLNTSASRYQLVERRGLNLFEQFGSGWDGDTVYPGVSEDVFSTVFVCTLNDSDYFRAAQKKNREWLERKYAKWLDDLNAPVGSGIYSEIAEVAAAVWTGWFYNPSEPDDTGEGGGDSVGKP